MADIRKRSLKSGETTYTVRVRVKGKPTQTKTFRKLAEAKQWAAMAETLTRQQKTDKLIKTQAPLLLQQAIDDFWRLKIYRAKNHSENMKLAHKFWVAYLQNKPFTEISKQDVSSGKMKLLDMGYAPGTVVKFMNALSVVFSHAQEYERVAINPVKLVKKPKEPKGIVRALSDTEQIALLEACQKSDNPFLFAIVTLALTTGGRKSELLELQWKYVDFVRKTVTFKDTKNGETRSVPMIGLAYALLRAMTPGQPKALVFPNARGETYQIRRAYETAVKRAGIEKFRFHDLRHTAASNLAMSGATLYELQIYFGWKTPAMASRYAHLTHHHLQGLAERMAERCGLMHTPSDAPPVKPTRMRLVSA